MSVFIRCLLAEVLLYNSPITVILFATRSLASNDVALHQINCFPLGSFTPGSSLATHQMQITFGSDQYKLFFQYKIQTADQVQNAD